MEIYFTEDEAAKVMFPDSENIRRETLTLTAEQKEFIEQHIGWKFPETSFTVYIGRNKRQNWWLCNCAKHHRQTSPYYLYGRC